LVEVQQG